MPRPHRIATLVLAAALCSGEDGYDPGRAGWGARVVPVPLAVQAERGLEPGEGALVVRVRPGGTAAGLGLQPGDVLLSLNGNPVASRQDVREVLAQVAPGNRAVAVLDDGGATREAAGVFKERQPRPSWPPGWLPGGPDGRMGGPDAMRPAPESPEETAARQYARLDQERRLNQLARAELARASAALAGEDGKAWYLTVDLRTPEATP